MSETPDQRCDPHTYQTLMPDRVAELARGWDLTWRGALLMQLHTAALLEAMQRRGGPRSAAEYTERDFLHLATDPHVVAAAEAARSQHRTDHPPTAPRAPRKRVLAKWEVSMQLVLGGQP